MPPFAVGIPDKANYGNIKALQEGNFYDLVLQEHDAERAGKHYDFRLGNSDIGLLSWAIPSAKLPAPGEKVLAIQQPLHSYDYRTFVGEIPSGYGKGNVSLAYSGNALVTAIDPDKKRIYFTIASDRHPRKFILLKPDTDKYGKDAWLLINITPNKPLPYVKVKYPIIDKKKLQQLLEKEDYLVAEPKIDGALGLVQLGNKGLEIFGHRISRVTGYPIQYTDKIFKTKPTLNLPLKYAGSILRGEVYAVKTLPDGSEVVVEPQILSAVLNSSVKNAWDRLRDLGLKLKIGLFDITNYGGNHLDPETVDYPARRKMLLEILQYLPKDTFTVIPYVDKKEDILKLLQEIESGQHPLTKEGIVVYRRYGYPYKYKIRPEEDVYIKRIIPGLGKYSDSAGAFEYSYTPDGPVVGTVGTGFSDEFRKFMMENAESLVGRRARVTYQEKFPSGALRAPSFIALHEDYPTVQEKQASFVLPEEDEKWLLAIDILKKVDNFIKKGDASSYLDIPVLELPVKVHNNIQKILGGPNPLTAMALDALIGMALGDLAGRTLEFAFPRFFADSKFRKRLWLAGSLLGASLPFYIHGIQNLSTHGLKGLLTPSPIQEALTKSAIDYHAKKLRVLAEDLTGKKIIDDINPEFIKEASVKLAAKFDVSEWGKTVLDTDLSPWEKTLLVTVPLTASMYRDSDWVTPVDVAKVSANMELGSLFGRLLGDLAVPILGLPRDVKEDLQRTGRLTGLLKGFTGSVKNVLLNTGDKTYDEIGKALQI